MWDRLKEKRGEGGFTLIELLIVIIILAILAAIVVFAVGTTSKNSVAASCRADAKSVETATEAYKAQTGAFPTDTTQLTQASGTVGPWLRALPGTGHYNVIIAGSGSIYVVGSAQTTAASSTTNNFDVTPTICDSFS
jgi:general secretion pathway protein G